MVIKVLGSGCAGCNRLGDLAERAVQELGIEAEIVKVTDVPGIMAYGVMSTPGLVIDEEVRLAGRVPSYDEVKRILSNVR